MTPKSSSASWTRTRERAWSAYSESLRDRVGDDYEHAERESWAELQSELQRLERRRQTLNQTSG